MDWMEYACVCVCVCVRVYVHSYFNTDLNGLDGI